MSKLTVANTTSSAYYVSNDQAKKEKAGNVDRLLAYILTKGSLKHLQTVKQLRDRVKRKEINRYQMGLELQKLAQGIK